MKIVDCGDIPVTPYDNKFAIRQIENGHKELLHRPTFSPLGNDSLTGQPLVPISLDGKHHPRVVTLGGDHTIVLPLLRFVLFQQVFRTSGLILRPQVYSLCIRPNFCHPLRLSLGHMEAFRVRRCSFRSGRH